MNILVTGSKGMLGTALVNNLKMIRAGKNIKCKNLSINEIYEYDINVNQDKLDLFCKKADFVFHLAGVNRPQNSSDYMKENCGFSSHLLHELEKNHSRATIMLASSIQASLCGKYENSEYGKSKKASEELFFEYGEKNNVKVAVYRFPNIMGHSRPKYNSAISTFCWAIANDESYEVSNRYNEIEVLYIDDLIEGMYDLLDNKETRCSYDKNKIIINNLGRFCCVPKTYKVSLGKIVDLLESFKNYPFTLNMPSMPNDSFEKKLYSLYLSYLPKNKIKFDLISNKDTRGSFTEIMHTQNCGQVSVNVSKPGVTKGQHWHNSKWEIFIVVKGHALIQERNINSDELMEFEVSDKKFEAVYMIPGWTHSIVNLSDKDDLVTVMICNERFDKKNPDTYAENI